MTNTHFVSGYEVHQEDWGDGPDGAINGDGYVGMGDTEGGNEDVEEDTYGDGEDCAYPPGGDGRSHWWPNEL